MKNKLIILIGMLSFFGLACSKNEQKQDAPAPDEPKKESLRVMTFNIHIGNPPGAAEGTVDLEASAAVIKAAKPDLLALQEVDRFTDRSGKTLDQAKALGELTGMHVYFVPAMERSNGEYGNAILSKYPILESKRFTLEPEAGTDAEPRALGVVQVELPNKQTLVFAVTHLDHKQESNRALQSRTALNALKDYTKDPILLAGDFNMTPDSENWAIWEKDFQMGCSDCPYTFSVSNPYKTVDYILLSNQAKAYFSLVNYDVIPDQEASDHIPVLADLEYELEAK